MAGKVSKAEAEYQARPRGSQECRRCEMFRPRQGSEIGLCTKVSGPIQPSGWCRFFYPLEEAEDEK